MCVCVCAHTVAVIYLWKNWRFVTIGDTNIRLGCCCWLWAPPPLALSLSRSLHTDWWLWDSIRAANHYSLSRPLFPPWGDQCSAVICCSQNVLTTQLPAGNDIIGGPKAAALFKHLKQEREKRKLQLCDSHLLFYSPNMIMCCAVQLLERERIKRQQTRHVHISYAHTIGHPCHLVGTCVQFSELRLSKASTVFQHNPRTRSSLYSGTGDCYTRLH